MKNKSLSQQLCEICGIKPLNNETAYFTGNIGKLPDFENNDNNFVRLGELKLNYENYETIFYLVNYLSDDSLSTKKEFLKYLLNILSDTTTYKFYILLQEKIKQVIREEKWEYEE